MYKPDEPERMGTRLSEDPRYRKTQGQDMIFAVAKRIYLLSKAGNALAGFGSVSVFVGAYIIN